MTDCIFCRIASGEIPAKVVARAAGVMAFHDLNAQAPVHVLIIPEEHWAGARDTPGAPAGLWDALFGLAVQAARGLGVEEGGYRLVVNQGGDGGQSVGHLHVHLLGGRRMGWPPG